MPSATTNLGHGLAKVLGIKLNYRNELSIPSSGVTRGESVFSVSSADTYVEDEPTSWEWIKETTPGPHDAVKYLLSLFPFLSWIGHYNLSWLAGDLVAGITIGAVVVPQGMAYAKLAQLSVEFGLYSAFMGVTIYWIFATSKDITIGPVAVMSTIVGNIVIDAKKTHPHIPGHVIASALAIICGAIVCGIGLLRLGWIVDFISLTAVSAFITGSALSIAAGQIPTLLGITGTPTRGPAYLIVIGILKHLGRSNLNAAMGVTALAMLYGIRYACNKLGKAYPSQRKLIFFINTLRTVFVILLYTMISWLVNRHHRKKPKFAILMSVPRGFQDAAVPTINSNIISAFASQLPASVIVLLIEHIAIAKSFGRINNYTINPSQELIAIGVSNLLGPFLGAYPVTGSFSRTAIKSKAGVRTPLAGVITAIVVLLAIYALTAVFFYIPSATLAAVIIHAVGDLITPPNTVYQFWKISPLEVLIFFAGVLVTVFSSIENGIYTTICVSVALLLFRVAKARGRFLGRVKIHSVVGDHVIDRETNDDRSKSPTDKEIVTRNVFLPLDHNDGTNPSIELSRPFPGIFMYRFSEGFNYPNVSHYLEHMIQTIFAETRRTNRDMYAKPGDRPWNDPGPRRGRAAPDDFERPTLKAVVLDFSSVNNVDVTSVQYMIDVRNQLDRYAAPDKVEWHFACINNRWTKRALASAGFGYPTTDDNIGDFQRWKPIFSVAEIGGSDSAAADAQILENQRRNTQTDIEARPVMNRGHSGKSDRIATASSSSSAEDIGLGDDLEKAITNSKVYGGSTHVRGVQMNRIAVIHGVNRPYFHVDLTSALNSAIASAERREHNMEVDD